MLDILAITSPIYLVVLAGYLATRSGVFNRADMAVFGKFVLNLALPALIFNALAQRHISDVLHPTYLLAYLGGSLLSMTTAYLIGRRLCGWNGTRSTFLAMGVSCSNSSFIGASPSRVRAWEIALADGTSQLARQFPRNRSPFTSWRITSS